MPFGPPPFLRPWSQIRIPFCLPAKIGLLATPSPTEVTPLIVILIWVFVCRPVTLNLLRSLLNVTAVSLPPMMAVEPLRVTEYVSFNETGSPFHEALGMSVQKKSTYELDIKLELFTFKGGEDGTKRKK